MEFIFKQFSALTLDELYEILKVRAKIFVVEQGIKYVDMDDIDYRSWHCFIKDNGSIVAYLRTFYDDEKEENLQIGRVLTLEHGKGLGKELMERTLFAIKEKVMCRKIGMNAQEYAVDFYKMFGFEVVSNSFLEEGISHVKMEMKIG